MTSTCFTVSSQSRTYDVIICTDFKKHLSKRIEKESNRVFIVTDSILKELHLETVTQYLIDNGITVFHHIIPPGETSKSLEIVEEIYRFLIKHNATRFDMIIAFGGGVIGDVTGFVASTFKRGMNFIQIPTTLLAQVDSCLGGKNGVNLYEGKNLVGTFYQPIFVLVDISLLNTLGERDFKSGLSEVVKYAVTMDQNLFEFLYENHEDILARNSGVLFHIVQRSLENKARIIELDEQEQFGIREILNFGHTIGHAIETCESHRITHGEAVALGMISETKAAVSMGIGNKQCIKKLVDLLTFFGIAGKIKETVDIEQLVSIISHDKKIQGNVLNMPVLTEIGRVEMIRIDHTRFFLETLRREISC